MVGSWPEYQIDHKDLDVTNNKWENLRHATQSENQRNKRMHKCNKTGYKGVSIEKSNGGRIFYRASMTYNGKNLYIRLFDNPKEAWLIKRIVKQLKNSTNHFIGQLDKVMM